MGPRAGLDRCGKSGPTGIRSSDSPARSQSLYRLSYPGPQCQRKAGKNFGAGRKIWSSRLSREE